jgi:hypothetical protein
LETGKVNDLMEVREEFMSAKSHRQRSPARPPVADLKLWIWALAFSSIIEAPAVKIAVNDIHTLFRGCAAFSDVFERALSMTPGEFTLLVVYLCYILCPVILFVLVSLRLLRAGGRP